MLKTEEMDQWRLGLHLMPPKGWLNDPNGLCQFHGIYHVFFQYSPENPEGGMKYWGHYKSADLLNWEYAGIALSPDQEFDKNGVYSGSAFIDGDKMHLYYTGNVKLQGDYNYITNGRQGNTILVTSEDGLYFGEKQCLLTNSEYPGNLTCHVRDPKVVKGDTIGEEKESNYMFLGARTMEDEGQVLVYKSNTLTGWKLVNIIHAEAPFGFMWECPDGFVLGDRKILSISPQGVDAQGVNYANMYQSGYYEFDGSFEGEYSVKNFKEWDRGFDFYAPQTFLDEKGRRILIGWIGMPDDPGQTNPTISKGWQNALTVPREVFLKEGKVKQYPVEELKSLRKEERTLQTGSTSLELAMYDAMLNVEADSNVRIIVSDGLTLEYNKEAALFSLSFDEEKNYGYGRKSRAVHLETCTDIRILADTSCLEVYLNGGEEVFTTRFYTESGRSCFKVEQGRADVTYWELRPMQISFANETAEQ